MNRRAKDLLLKAAFGEANERDRAELEGLTARDSAAREESELLRSLRSDLVSLRGVPACQVSTERMRDAVLRAGMKQRPASSGWAWVLGPALGALAAFGALSYGHRQSPSLRGFETLPPSAVALSKPVDELFPKAALSLPHSAPVAATKMEKVVGPEAQPAPAANRLALAAAPRQRRSAASALRTAEDGARATGASHGSTVAAPPPAASKTMTASAMVAGVGPAPAADDAPVVIVSSVPNNDTGAPDAAENDKGNHVVFGG